MYGNNRNSGIPRLHSYEQALKWWTDTKPIRRRATDDRPLGHRRNTWYLINKRDDDAIECLMYGAPIVTFFKDGHIAIMNYRYNSISTANFIYDVLRNVTAYVFDHSLVIGVGNQEQRLRTSQSLMLRRDDGGNYHFADHKPEVTHVINRANAKEIRVRHKDFMQYLDGMAKLRGADPYSRDELSNQLGQQLYNLDLGRVRYYNLNNSEAETMIESIKLFKQYISDKSEDRHINYYKAMLIMVHSYGKYDWNTSGFIGQIDTMLSGFDKALMGIYRDEYLDAKTTDTGKVKRDAYGAYFNGVWGGYHKA